MKPPILTPLLARQPIASLTGEVFGYELLYRGSTLGTSATAMSAQVLCEAMSNQGLAGVVGEAHVFVNFAQDLLTTEVPLLLPAGRGVVEIVEDVQPSPAVIETLQKVHRCGLAIALDDFMFQTNMIPFLPYADFIKVDIQQSACDLDDIVKRLKHYPVPLIAEKVETLAEAKRCSELGFRLFQGYFFARPETIRANSVGASEVAVVSLIADLQNPDREPEELAQSIGMDLGLTHRILKLCNSVSYRRQRPIASIDDAVILLGRDVLAQWASLLLMTRLAQQKPVELYAMALIRARLCQALGTKSQFRAGELYTVGLLSLLDALLDRPMEALVSDLALAPLLRDALCGNPASDLGAILRKAVAYESGDWASLGSLTVDEATRLSAAFAGATRFARIALAR